MQGQEVQGVMVWELRDPPREADDVRQPAPAKSHKVARPLRTPGLEAEGFESLNIRLGFSVFHGVQSSGSRVQGSGFRAEGPGVKGSRVKRFTAQKVARALRTPALGLTVWGFFFPGANQNRPFIFCGTN